MIGKKKINQIKSLIQKKNRLKENLFLIEGDKIVLEVANSRFRIKELFATSEFIYKNNYLPNNIDRIIEVSYEDLRKASLLKHPQQSLALCYLPHEEILPSRMEGISFYLDGIQDPGNLGTILRTADWFGMNHLYCSPDTVDIFNPKVIQSSMGSFIRIKTFYTPFDELAEQAYHNNISLFGTFMEGENIYQAQLLCPSILVLGNEGNGIRQGVAKKIKNRLHIPSFKSGLKQPESLNVAVAAGILASEFMRRPFIKDPIQNES